MRLLSIVGVICAAELILTLFPNSEGQGTIEQDARELWEKVIAAKGGHERLSLVRNIHISCRALKPYPRRGYTGLGARREELYVFPDRVWGWIDNRPSPFGLQLVTRNGERNLNWRLTDDNPTHPAQVVADDRDRYSSVEVQLSYFLETRWVKPVPIAVSHGTLAGKRVDVVHTDTVWGKDKAEYYLDPITHLPLKVVVHGPGPDGIDRKSTSNALGDYVSVDGIQMPTKQGNFDADTTDQTTLCSTEINVDYDETIFDHPPRIEDGPDAWRPHRKP